MNSKQQGVSMLEVLITIVVMSFGFLPLIAFQMGALKQLQGSNQQYVVTALSNSITESILANADEATEYHNAKLEEIDVGQACTTQACKDLVKWKEALTGYGMQDLEGLIEVDGNLLTVELSWLEKTMLQKKNNDGETIRQRYSMQVSL